MDKIQLLQRYYDTFIDLTSPRDFFVGMADYLDYANSLPEFATVARDVSAPKAALVAKLNETQKTALQKLFKVKDELKVYVDEHKIDNPAINEAFKEYAGWLAGKITGSYSMPDALHDKLHNVVEFLYHLPEHKAFAERYIQFSQDRTYVRHYLPLDEYQTYREIEDEIEAQRPTAMWAVLDEVSTLYVTIKSGREQLSDLVKEHRAKATNALAWNILNHRILVDDWRTVESGNGKNYFFKVDKVRPMLARIHNYLLTRLVVGEVVEKAVANITTATPVSKFKPQLFSKKAGKAKAGFLRLYDGGKAYKIAGITTRQFLLVQCLFSSENKLAAPYSPVFRSYESVFEAIQQSKDKTNGRLRDTATKDAAMRDIIEWAIKELQKNRAIRGYLKFEREANRMRLQITLPEGDDEGS